MVSELYTPTGMDKHSRIGRRSLGLRSRDCINATIGLASPARGRERNLRVLLIA